MDKSFLSFTAPSRFSQILRPKLCWPRSCPQNYTDQTLLYSGESKHPTMGSKSKGPDNIKMIFYQYRKSHCGDKMVIRSSYLHNGISYTGKVTSLYWIRGAFQKRIWALNTLRPRQNGRHFPDYIFKCILLNEIVWITIKNPLKFVPKGPINTIPALVQIMAWRGPGDKPLSEPMLISLPTHICVTRPQWVKSKIS